MRKITLFLFAMAMMAALPLSAAITVVSTSGETAYMEGSSWKPLAKGQKISEGTKISTGLKSQIVLDVDGSILTIKPLTSVKIYKNMASDKSRTTSVGLQYGSVQAKVNKVPNVKTKFNVTTPVATSSVRGTEEIVSFGPQNGMRIDVIEGVIEAHNDEGVSSTVSGRSVFEMSEGDNRPDDLLGNLSEDFSVDITSDFISGDESDTIEMFGDDYFEGIDDFNDFINSEINPFTNGTGELTIQLVWPQDRPQ